ESAEPIDAEHGRDDGADHHFQHREVGEVELAGELARVAETGALERDTERDSDQHGNRELAHCQALFISGATMYPATNAAATKIQLPTASTAPPVSASPLVQPRASTA